MLVVGCITTAMRPAIERWLLDHAEQATVADAGAFRVHFADPKSKEIVLRPDAVGRPEFAFDAVKAALRREPLPGDVLVLGDAGRGRSMADVASVEASVMARIRAFAGSVLIVILAASVFSGGRPLAFLVGEDNRYSNSKCQLALWFGAAMTVYLATLWLRLETAGPAFMHGIEVPTNVLLLSGASAFTLGAAKVLTVQKLTDGLAADPEHDPKPPADRPRLDDLVRNDRNGLDLGDLQMILITVVAVAVFLADAFFQSAVILQAATVTLPDVDTSLLAAFGISQAAYLGKKGAGAADGS